MIKDVKNYKSKLNIIETQEAIKFIKDFFQKSLAKRLNLLRVSAPLFVLKSSGLNDDLNGFERPLSFVPMEIKEELQVVQSLAKWKRFALKKYDFEIGTGLYTDMNAIRQDECLDNIHSLYVDQWDYEIVINEKDRNLNFLFSTVNKIYKSLLETEKAVNSKYKVFNKKLSRTITFISAEDLVHMYPSSTKNEREKNIVKLYGAVFIYGIGYPIQNDDPYDGRAADYDDWFLNGDIIVYNPVLDDALELSSMGIRVNAKSLKAQIEFRHEEKKLNSPYSQSILNNNLPLTLGGGIGQSRLCMFFLEKAHIGEVQASVWTESDVETAKKENIFLL
jgi:aspartate--ammonia ligase